jgi:hypothetical protein
MDQAPWQESGNAVHRDGSVAPGSAPTPAAAAGCGWSVAGSRVDLFDKQVRTFVTPLGSLLVPDVIDG